MTQSGERPDLEVADLDLSGLARVLFAEDRALDEKERVRPILERRVRALQRRILTVRGWQIPDEREFLDTAFQELMSWAVGMNREGKPRFDRSRPFGPWCRHWLTIRARRRINLDREARLEFENRMASAAPVDDVSNDSAGTNRPSGSPHESNFIRRWVERAWFRKEPLSPYDLSLVEG